MLFLTPEQLDSQCVSHTNINTASQIQCSNKLFNRGPKFTSTERQAAIEFVRKCLQEGVFCFIQDNQSSLVVWTESQDVPLTDETSSLPKMKESSQFGSGLSESAAKLEVTGARNDLEHLSKSQLTQAHRQFLKKTSYRVYRGITY
ncbi:MAG: hypothetical protein F6K47_13205 [Symploca sp. SIO2E6]|nr:hypothetical protein [Symploca sp. SIO2E6]